MRGLIIAIADQSHYSQ